MMICPQCKADNREGVNFCTTCGFKVEGLRHKTDSSVSSTGTSASQQCKSCGAGLKPDANFCIGCGSPADGKPGDVVGSDAAGPAGTEGSGSNNAISMIRDRIFWNVQPGEIAHRFSETVLSNYDNAIGIVINEGTTAYIRADGELVAEIDGGVYDFVEKNTLKKTLEKREGGIFDSLKKGFRFLSNLVLGKQLKDKIKDDDPKPQTDKEQTLARVIKGMKTGKVFSVTLKLNKSFPLIFEMEGIETKILDTTVGLHAFFRISDFKTFSEYHLSHEDSVTLEKLHDALLPVIKPSVQNALYDLELEESRLPEDLLEKIAYDIQNNNKDMFYGLVLERIVTISSNNQDIKRFRELRKELYLSEKELDYLVRTNEFRNRLTLQQNAQLLAEAKNDNDFFKQMQEINKDHLLAEDEMEKFYLVLSREKRIREATNEDEVKAALIDIEKTGLLREEDLENLHRSIKERSVDHAIHRFHSLELLQMNQAMEIEHKKLQWEHEIGDKRIDLELDRIRKTLQARIGFSELQIEQWKQEDDYKDSKFYKELEKTKAESEQNIAIDQKQREMELDLEMKEMQARLEQMRQLKGMEAEAEKRRIEQEMSKIQQEQDHAKELYEIERMKAENLAKTYQDMSFEQIMAANPDLTPESAQALSEKFKSEAAAASSNKEAEFARENQRKMEDYMREQNDRYERMMNKFLDTQATTSGHLLKNKDQEKDEYKERLAKEQERVDRTQDKALEFTTRHPNTGHTPHGAKQYNPPPPPPTQDYFVDLPGKENKPFTREQIQELIKKNEISTYSLIWSPIYKDWMHANNLNEFNHLLGTSPPTNPGTKSVGHKICQQCGDEKIEEGARFCPNCGKEPGN